ncbi:hypothetical protein QQ73_06055, partial [Candidatus Endoriftia persephone str. Guaymas]|nr:hypothetical protein [Candidatus Endoriftia persephone str. Guaymas]
QLQKGLSLVGICQIGLDYVEHLQHYSLKIGNSGLASSCSSTRSIFSKRPVILRAEMLSC